MDENLKIKILFEISQIDALIEKSLVLNSKCKISPPDFIELCAIGSILHSFYNGIESIFILICKNVDKIHLGGEKWHSDILRRMFAATEKRPAIFEEDFSDMLNDYMGFRHFFRHAYGHSIQWNKAKPLFMNLNDNWTKIKEKIEKILV